MKHDEEHSSEEETMHELAKAQKTLDEIESKIRIFRNKKKQETKSNIAKVPFPDLNKYFSFLSQQYESNAYNESLYSQNTAKRETNQDFYKKIVNQVEWQLDKENQSLSINQKLQSQKNESITKIEEYYIQRNEALELKIKMLKEAKQKIKKEQKLLIRNNEQLEEEIEKRREGFQLKNNAQELIFKIQKMKNKILHLEEQNKQINTRKKQMQKCVKETLKGHKHNLYHELQSRSKSSSAIRCKYH